MPPLPKIAWLYCQQGTIACRAKSNLETATYWACPDALEPLDLPALRKIIPEVDELVEITSTYEVEFRDSAETWIECAKWIMSLPPDLPVIVTRGTGVLSDMAFFLDIVLSRPAPIVVTGAMRPSTALSCDGPYNLAQACGLAAHSSSRNRGVMLLFNDRITSAYFAQKTSASRLDTFKSFEAGHLGLMTNLTPHFFYEPARATNKPTFDVSNLQDLPKVALITCYLDQDLEDLDNKLADKNVKGLVLAGLGTSIIPHAWTDRTEELAECGFPVVRTSICPDSHISPSYYTRNQIAAGDLGPAKAYLLLRLAIACYGQDIDKIRQAFGTDLQYTSFST